MILLPCRHLETSLSYSDCGHQYCPGMCSKTFTAVCSCGSEFPSGNKDNAEEKLREHVTTSNTDLYRKSMLGFNG